MNRKFLIFQALISILVLVFVAFYLQMPPVGYILGMAVTIFWLTTSYGLLVYSLHTWRTPADAATMLRFFLGIVSLIVACYIGEAKLLIFVMMVIASLGDWIDGWLATVYGSTPQGAILDAETDQVLVFMLAVLGIVLGGVGVWLLLFPLYRYGYILLLEVFAIPADNPKPKEGDNLRARFVCAVTQLILLANLLPDLALSVKTLLSMIALAVLTYSFADDVFYQFRKRFKHSLSSSAS